jgi:hypothetical protein
MIASLMPKSTLVWGGGSSGTLYNVTPIIKILLAKLSVSDKKMAGTALKKRAPAT